LCSKEPISETTVALSELHGRGLGGNIVKVSPAQLIYPERALWTGEAHQLAFLGERGDYRLGLRRMEVAYCEAIREVPD
ncbi:hypothetical protein ACK899_26685, partial [Klebsiella pneumoniae]|uniref:hypothetical protein n=1 Tax=Klebsiella pneumoniae TaxID=573 RepID=UPI003974C146